MSQVRWLDSGDLEFPDPELALKDPNGLLAIGGDLSEFGVFWHPLSPHGAGQGLPATGCLSGGGLPAAPGRQPSLAQGRGAVLGLGVSHPAYPARYRARRPRQLLALYKVKN